MSDFDSFNASLSPVSPLFKPVIYTVKQGDTLSQIISNFYDVTYGSDRYKSALALVSYHNKQITNPNLLQPKQVIRLMPMTPNSVGMCLASDENKKVLAEFSNRSNQFHPTLGDGLDKYKMHIPIDTQEQEMLWALSWLQDNYDILATSSGAALNSMGGLVNQQNTALIQEVERLYNQYKKGTLTKGQYDYRRQKALKAFAQRLGPFEKVLLKGQTARQALQISRSKAIPATANVTNHLDRLGRLSKLATHGGVVLTAAGVGMGCYNIATAQSRQEKNEIFVETVAGSLVSAGTGYALATFLITTPVGWATILVLGSAAAIGSYAAGKGARELYTMSGNKADLVSLSGVDKLCK
ncbi:LysM peptidoglycan-binding domain-containing protein [Marinomonas lutimaris]|uniref:LysM peptidoglycan-binding domain-containing protein n=1 Tax=Marinomonas lutimaris TaxID=2846746 RepID=UPI001CA4D7D7|nr:LysM domain-containing protein [Marinomonas lutimaris]